MNTTWFFTLTAVFFVSLISLVGIFFISLKEEQLKKILLILVSFSVGGLFGGAFIHIMPEVVREVGFSPTVSLFLLSGIIFFFVLEKLIFWRHCHIPTSKEHPHPFTYLNFIGGSCHNFIDGMVIAASFLVSPIIGLSTTLAVALHEIPHEIGEFGVYVYGGFSKWSALGINFLSGIIAFAGACLVLLSGLKESTLASTLLPFTAGGFIYIAGTDLIPELKKEVGLKHTLIQLTAILLGLGMMAIFLYFEH